MEEEKPAPKPTVTIEEDKKESKLKKKPLKKSSLSTKSKSSKLAKSSAVAEVETKQEDQILAAEMDTPSEPKAEEQPVENGSMPTEEPKIDEAEIPKDEIVPSEEVPIEDPNEVCSIFFWFLSYFYLQIIIWCIQDNKS